MIQAQAEDVFAALRRDTACANLQNAYGALMVSVGADPLPDTFQHFFSAEGAAAFAVTLSLVKVVHELGHAYVAKSFGCRIPTMGVALLVMLPVLYTDVGDSWRLPSRRQRLAIGVAGVAAELGLALAEPRRVAGGGARRRLRHPLRPGAGADNRHDRGARARGEGGRHSQPSRRRHPSRSFPASPW